MLFTLLANTNEKYSPCNFMARWKIFHYSPSLRGIKSDGADRLNYKNYKYNIYIYMYKVKYMFGKIVTILKLTCSPLDVKFIKNMNPMCNVF